MKSGWGSTQLSNVLTIEMAQQKHGKATLQAEPVVVRDQPTQVAMYQTETTLYRRVALNSRDRFTLPEPAPAMFGINSVSKHCLVVIALDSSWMALTADIWDYLFHTHIPVGKLSRFEVVQLQYVSKDFAMFFRPLMYHHVNLLSCSAASIFVTTLTKVQSTLSHVVPTPVLARCVLSLQISFNLEEDTPAHRTFWDLWGQLLPLLTSLKTLSICYSHDDADCLGRFIRSGRLSQHLPRAVKRLHFKPLCDEFFECSAEDSGSSNPWDSSDWRLSISLIPHIRQLIVTTPTYIVWPPTRERYNTVMNMWTAQLRRGHHTSQLDEIVIHCASGDEGESLNQWEGELGYGIEGRHLGANWVWRKQDSGAWANDEYSESWAYVDLKVSEREFRRSLKRERRQVPYKSIE
ncbi:hypothetical protein B0H11DRAFT_1913803 [Mycena galericulata]|nr:hypothetical protein B0H11DRAFT_1913803 [Mycena galericulata]